VLHDQRLNFCLGFFVGFHINFSLVFCFHLSGRLSYLYISIGHLICQALFYKSLKFFP
jgi:hypothetical protein